MAQIINDPYLEGGGSEAGKSFADMLKTNIETYANHKLGELNRNKQATVFRELGISPAIAQLSPEHQSLYIKRLHQQEQQQRAQEHDLRQSDIAHQRQQQNIRLKAELNNQGIGGVGGGLNPKQQAQVDRANAPFNKQFSQVYDTAERGAGIIQQLRELDMTGKVRSGVKGKLPSWLPGTTDETQQADKLLNQLVGLIDAQLPGRGSATRLKLTAAGKPSLSHSVKTRLKMYDDLEKEFDSVLTKGEIREQLIAENGYQQPANLETRINEIYKLQKLQNKQLERQQPQQQLPQVEGEESPLAYGARNLIRGGARAFESVAGAPGDLISAGLGAANYLSGGTTPTYGDLQKNSPVSIPTSENIKESLGKHTKGYTNPQSGAEEVFDDVIGTAAAIFGPGKLKQLAAPYKGLKAASKVLLPFGGIVSKERALGMALAGTGAGLTAEAFDFGPIGQGVAKMLAMTAAGTAGTRAKLERLRNIKYAARDAAFKDKFVSPKEAQHLLDSISRSETLTSHAGRPESKILTGIKQGTYTQLQNAMAQNNGKLPVSAVLKTKEYLNEWKGRPNKAPIGGGEYLPENLRKDFGSFVKTATDPLEHLASYSKQGALDSAIADNLHKGLKTADAIKKSLEDNKDILGSIKSGPVKELFHLFMGGAKSGYNKVKVMGSLLAKSSLARKVYGDALKAAAEKDMQAFARHIAKLDKIVAHEENNKQG